jgi:uncharacterized lipoprotein YehR (DUF1307 family)
MSSLACVDTSIKVLYEREGLDPERIAEGLELDVLSVKDALLRVSSQYRKLVKTQDKDKPEVVDVSDEEYQDILAHYKSLLKYADDQAIQERVGRFLIQLRKGVYDGKKVENLTGVNALTINNIILQTKTKAQEALEAAKDQFIDIESTDNLIENHG